MGQEGVRGGREMQLGKYYIGFNFVEEIRKAQQRNKSLAKKVVDLSQSYSQEIMQEAPPAVSPSASPAAKLEQLVRTPPLSTQTLRMSPSDFHEGERHADSLKAPSLPS